VGSYSTGSAATLYEYDEVGDQLRTGLDVDGGGTLDLGSNDRITESSTQFVSIDGAYWQQSSQRVYVEAGSSETKTTGVSRTRLTGLGVGLINEQVSIDLYGNETRSTVRVNPGSATETRTVDTPDSVQDAVTVTVAGRLVSSTTATGLTTTYGYDGLGRRTSTTDPRTGASEAHYDAQGRVDYVKDAAGYQTSFAYDPSTGRKIRETNALGKHSYFAYNAQGQLTRTWGDVPYPVQYGYDDYGRRTEMTTYRVEAGWSSPTWPESATGDTTRWHHQESTGLLQGKEDAAGKAVTYTYGPAGRLATRTWARRKPDGSPLVTSYAYDAATGELRGVDYNDNTPDVTHEFDRLGRATTITDAVGTRVFGYDPATLQLKTETIDGLTPARITHHYDPALVKGRSAGVELGEHYVVGYGYDQLGRIMSVGWTVNGSSDTATYSLFEQSDLLAGYAKKSGFASEYAYEPKRDLKTLVSNSLSGSVVSRYDYRYDAQGRRSSVESFGSAIAPPIRFARWGYDERNQVTGSNRFMGSFTTTPNPSNEIVGERRDYDYDAIGNRKAALVEDGVTYIGYKANGLNQYDSTGEQAPSYDEDGNLLSDGRKVLTYNAENQLKSVTVAGVSVSTYFYDYLGRRIRKSVHVLDGSGSDYVVAWVYSGWNKVEERETVGSTTTVKNFVWGLDLSESLEGAGGIGGLLAAVDQSGAASIFAYDGNGNVSELVAAVGGGVSAHYEYDAFGDVILALGVLASENNYRFSTKYADDETGFVYYGYRYYDSATGRWVNRDPIGESGGANLYGMVGNNPIDRFDVLGKRAGEIGLAMMNGETDGENNWFHRIAYIGAGNSYARTFRVNSAEEALGALERSSSACPIKRVTWAGHGWAYAVGGGNPEGPGLPGVADGSGLYEDGSGWINTGAGGRSVTDLRLKVAGGAIRFKAKCLIQIYACRVSVTFSSALHGATGCAVVAAHGGASPTKRGETTWGSGPTGDPTEAADERSAASDPVTGWRTGWYEVSSSRSGPRVVERGSTYRMAR